MATLLNTTINSTGFLKIPAGTTAQRPASPLAGMMRFNTDWSFQEYYDGTYWRQVLNGNIAGDGSSAALAATSAAAIKSLTGTNTDGVYWIQLPTAGATQIYCIMDSAYDGGGWMLGMKGARPSNAPTSEDTTFSYASTYWTQSNTLNPSDTTTANANAKYHSFNYFQCKDLLARFPDITTGTGGSIQGRGMWTWLENDFNGGARQTLIDFFNRNYPMQYGGGGLFKRDAKTFSGWASGIWSSQVDIRFYGFNYYQYNSAIGLNGLSGATSGGIRWGFGWNENSDGLWPSVYNLYNGSNDVFGGIGLTSAVGFHSGDKILCCQDTTGINRSARFEIYLR